MLSKTVLLRGIAILLVLAAVLVGCSESRQAEVSEVVDGDAVTGAAAAKTLALVNGDPVTERQLEDLLVKTLGQAQPALVGQATRERALDSLIAARAMSQQVLKDLTTEQLAAIDRKTAAYREELLVREYLLQNAEPQPVTAEMIATYYRNHPGEFAGDEIRTVEMLKLADTKRSHKRQLLQQLPRLQSDPNWPAYARDNPENLPLTFHKVRLQPGLFDKAIETQAGALQTGDAPVLVDMDSGSALIRVVAVEAMPPRSLAEVSGDIRRKLAAAELKQVVKRASDQAVSQAQVELNND